MCRKEANQKLIRKHRGEVIGYCLQKYSRVIFCAFVFFFNLVFIVSDDACADMAEEMAKCEAIKDKDMRLDCYDHITKQQDQTPSSMLEKLYELTVESRDNAPIVQWHNSNYFLLASYNSTPNRDMLLDVDPGAKAENLEVKFQLSGKVRPLPDGLLGDKLDFWFGYTQLSFWQLYNTPFSAPFRDTNYEPEGFFSYHTKREVNIFGFHMLDLRVVNAGVNHQSNGRARPLSRSWTRLFVEFCFEKIYNMEQEEGRHEFNLFVKAWHRLREDELDDDNPDITKYMGHMEIQGDYYWRHFRFSVMLRNNFRASNNKHAVQLEVSMPFVNLIQSDRVSLYLQYFHGYGESLLDYNWSSNRISLGIMINDWN